MGQSPEEKEARRLVKENGEFIRNTRHGELYAMPGGQTVMLYPPNSKSLDSRAWKNQLADVRRALRASEIGEIETEHEEAAMDAARLAQLGIHLQDKGVVTRTIRHATISARGLSEMLGLDPNTQVYLLDDEGKNPCLVETLQLKLVTETTQGDC